MPETTPGKKAAIFKARDYPPSSFVLPKDARSRKGKRLARDRRTLFLTLASFGEIAWPGVARLAKLCGFSRAKTFELLADLKQLGCVVDTVDAQGRRYYGAHGTRVRQVQPGALDGPGSSYWLPVKDVLTSEGKPLMVRFHNRPVQNSDPGVQDTNPGVQNSDPGVQNSETQESRIGIQESSVCVGHKRTSERKS